MSSRESNHQTSHIATRAKRTRRLSNNPNIKLHSCSALHLSYNPARSQSFKITITNNRYAAF